MQLLVNIDVDDTARAVDFYTAAFGVKVGRKLGEDVVELVGASVPIYLLASRSGSNALPGRAAPRDFRRHWTPVHLDIVVDDIDSAVRAALHAGAIQEGDIQSHAWGRLALMADPFGNGFCLIQFTGRGYGEIATA